MDWNKNFNSVCRIVLKEEVGNLDDFRGFLSRYVDPVKESKSAVSWKPVYYSEPYCKGSKIASFDEAEAMLTEPLKPTDMKDIDLLINAVQERFCYAGNKLGGLTNDIVESENVVESVHVYRSQDIINCENIAYSQMLVKNSKFDFGCSWGEDASFCINVSEISSCSRCFESGLVVKTSDAYFSYNCVNCNDVIFCFNQRARRHSIGNTELPKEKYAELKNKLLKEVADELRRKKTFPSLMELCFGGRVK
ncbi:MAG: hypothetical protein V1492_03550 [Candidatus Micrarchaeota archaeon]